MLIEVDSKKIYIEEYGKENKHTIIYFHGGPGASCLDFINQAKALGKKYHVISFDQYGVMRSDAIPDNEPFGMSDHIKLIDKIREILGISSWTVLGHSYGGMLACLYAYTFPENTSAVIYDCPAWNYILSAKSIASFFIPYFQKINSDEGLNNCNKVIEKDYINRTEIFDDVMTVLNMVTDKKERNYLHSISEEEYHARLPRQEIPENGWQKGNAHMQKLVDAGEIFNDYLPYLKEIEQPSLLLVGKYDPACGKDQRDYFRQFSVKGTIIEFQNSGHFPRIEEAQTYTESILNFLNANTH
jgi:proline iminopeptidase